MTTDLTSDSIRAKRTWVKPLLAVFAIALVGCVFYVRSHPLVFNESFWEHAHCPAQSATTFRLYASEHGGRFPSHTNGYGDALLLLVPDYSPTWSLLTGPGGYDPLAGHRWKESGGDVPEAECGRVYIQGLTETNNPDIAILFDKVPTPGGDHCHGLNRLKASLCRDVIFVSGSKTVIRESKWPDFASNQVELLVKDGYDRTVAQRLYAEKGRRL